MIEDTLDAYLKHYGVKGMRWGVRKSDYREYKEAATKDTSGALTRYFAAGGVKKTQVKFDEDWYNNLDTGKQFIEKNTKLNRATTRISEVTMSDLIASHQSDEDDAGQLALACEGKTQSAY